MESQHGLVTAILQNLEIAVLERLGPYSYAFIGSPPSFYTTLFPMNEDGSVCVTPWEHSVLLESFMEDVEDFVLDETADDVSSGIWQEDNFGEADMFLTASAQRLNGHVVLIIRNMTRDYPNHMAVLQKARENLLAQKKLHRSLSFYKQRSSYDALTSLYNRETFLGLMQAEVNQSLFSGQPLALLMIDIDNFKMINDTYGHLVGDSVLRSIGMVFKDILRSKDIASRYGGEEFIICTLGTSLEQAGFLAEKVRQAVETHTFDAVPKVTVSIGVTTFHRDDTLESCIHRADVALYQAKANGKNMVCFEE